MFYSQLGIDLAHKPTVKILFFAGNARHIWILEKLHSSHALRDYGSGQLVVY